MDPMPGDRAVAVPDHVHTGGLRWAETGLRGCIGAWPCCRPAHVRERQDEEQLVQKWNPTLRAPQGRAQRRWTVVAVSLHAPCRRASTPQTGFRSVLGGHGRWPGQRVPTLWEHPAAENAQRGRRSRRGRCQQPGRRLRQPLLPGPAAAVAAGRQATLQTGGSTFSVHNKHAWRAQWGRLLGAVSCRVDGAITCYRHGQPVG